VGPIGSKKRRRDVAGLSYEEDMEQLLYDLEEEYTPTEKQEATMRGLCRELGLSFQQEVKQLTSQEAYSDKIGELLKQKKEKKAHDQAVTPAQ